VLGEASGRAPAGSEDLVHGGSPENCRSGCADSAAPTAAIVALGLRRLLARRIALSRCSSLIVWRSSPLSRSQPRSATEEDKGSCPGNQGWVAALPRWAGRSRRLGSGDRPPAVRHASRAFSLGEPDLTPTDPPIAIVGLLSPCPRRGINFPHLATKETRSDPTASICPHLAGPFGRVFACNGNNFA
jgi:hypothetical protein